MTARLTKQPHRFGHDGAYSAFPTSWALPDGRLVLAWREGTDHVDTRDGHIRTSWSSDGGRTWTAPQVTVPYPGGGIDLRDPSISANTDGSTLYLTYFKGTTQLAAAGCYLRTSTDHGATWSGETRIDNQPYAAICAPAVHHDGKLWVTYYGRQPGDTRDSVYAAHSTNNGATWTTLRVANGQADGRDYQDRGPSPPPPGSSSCSAGTTTSTSGASPTTTTFGPPPPSRSTWVPADPPPHSPATAPCSSSTAARTTAPPSTGQAPTTAPPGTPPASDRSSPAPDG